MGMENKAYRKYETIIANSRQDFFNKNNYYPDYALVSKMTGVNLTTVQKHYTANNWDLHPIKNNKPRFRKDIILLIEAANEAWRLGETFYPQAYNVNAYYNQNKDATTRATLKLMAKMLAKVPLLADTV
jgi:hypothetical protein